MVYRLSQDIDPDASIDCGEFDIFLSRTLGAASSALKRVTNLDESARLALSDLVEAFGSTHKSIRKLMGTIEKSDGLTADGMSLVREQIEKVFTVALLAEDPCKWREAYLKDGWVRLYKEWLYEKEETANLPRFVESANKNEALLERLRLGLGITEAEKEFVEHKFYYPEQSLPAHLAGSKIDAFPSPKMASEKVSPARRGYLNRWHIEYVYFCGFSHVLMDKQIVMQMQRDTSLQAIEPRANLLEVHAGRGLMGSYMAGACAAADVYTLTGDIELMVELSSFWTRMTKVSLTAISLWEQGIKQILPAQVDAID